MSVTKLKQEIKTALNEGKDAQQELDKEVNVDMLRDLISEKISQAVRNYLKTVLNAVIGGATPVPQDGGATLKTGMVAKIKSI